MKVALYARVSTADKDQEPETQLLGLRDYCERQGWDVVMAGPAGIPRSWRLEG
jgi:DNA invertase Pin-like site-specific DNA recombinase